MDTQVFEDLKARSRKLSIYEGSAWSVMDGFGLRFIVPYALALGANNRVVGLLNALPSLFGNLTMLGTLQLMRKWTRKRICMTGVLVQALLWLFIIGTGALYFILDMRGQAPAYGVLIVYTVLIMGGCLPVPAWGSWMKDLVSRDIGNFFGRRNRICGSVGLICMLIASFFLDFMKGYHIYLGFVVLFTISFFARMTSYFILRRQYEPHFEVDETAYFSLLQFLRKMRHNNFGKFVITTGLFSIMVQIAAPFTTVYLLKTLRFSYVQFTIIVLAASITSLIILPFWGRFADRYGNLKAIKMTSIGVGFIPFLWLASYFFMDRGTTFMFIFLIVVQLLSGFIWPGYDMSVGNFIFDAVTRQRMSICSCYFSILNGMGVLIGSMLGGFISSSHFMDRYLFWGMSSLIFLFLISGFGRLAVALLFYLKIKEVRPVEEFGFKEASAHLNRLSPMRFLEFFNLNFLRRP
ncbi:MAG: MFS transporter [Fibrobacterota bacterium]